MAEIKEINTPTEVDHYQIRRVIDIYVATRTEALDKVGRDINKLIANTKADNQPDAIGRALWPRIRQIKRTADV